MGDNFGTIIISAIRASFPEPIIPSFDIVYNGLHSGKDNEKNSETFTSSPLVEKKHGSSKVVLADWTQKTILNCPTHNSLDRTIRLKLYKVSERTGRKRLLVEEVVPISNLATSFIKHDVPLELYDSQGGKVSIKLSCEAFGAPFWLHRFKLFKKLDITEQTDEFDAFCKDLLAFVSNHSYKDKFAIFLKSKNFLKDLLDYFVTFYSKAAEFEKNFAFKSKLKKKELLAHEILQSRLSMFFDIISSLMKEPILLRVFMDAEYPKTVIAWCCDAPQALAVAGLDSLKPAFSIDQTQVELVQSGLIHLLIHILNPNTELGARTKDPLQVKAIQLLPYFTSRFHPIMIKAKIMECVEHMLADQSTTRFQRGVELMMFLSSSQPNIFQQCLPYLENALQRVSNEIKQVSIELSSENAIAAKEAHKAVSPVDFAPVNVLIAQFYNGFPQPAESAPVSLVYPEFNPALPMLPNISRLMITPVGYDSSVIPPPPPPPPRPAAIPEPPRTAAIPEPPRPAAIPGPPPGMAPFAPVPAAVRNAADIARLTAQVGRMLDDPNADPNRLAELLAQIEELNYIEPEPEPPAIQEPVTPAPPPAPEPPKPQSFYLRDIGLTDDEFNQMLLGGHFNEAQTSQTDVTEQNDLTASVAPSSQGDIFATLTEGLNRLDTGNNTTTDNNATTTNNDNSDTRGLGLNESFNAPVSIPSSLSSSSDISGSKYDNNTKPQEDEALFQLFPKTGSNPAQFLAGDGAYKPEEENSDDLSSDYIDIVKPSTNSYNPFLSDDEPVKPSEQSPTIPHHNSITTSGPPSIIAETTSSSSSPSNVSIPPHEYPQYTARVLPALSSNTELTNQEKPLEVPMQGPSPSAIADPYWNEESNRIRPDDTTQPRVIVTQEIIVTPVPEGYSDAEDISPHNTEDASDIEELPKQEAARTPDDPISSSPGTPQTNPLQPPTIESSSSPTNRSNDNSHQNDTSLHSSSSSPSPATPIGKIQESCLLSASNSSLDSEHRRTSSAESPKSLSIMMLELERAASAPLIPIIRLCSTNPELFKSEQLIRSLLSILQYCTSVQLKKTLMETLEVLSNHSIKDYLPYGLVDCLIEVVVQTCIKRPINLNDTLPDFVQNGLKILEYPDIELTPTQLETLSILTTVPAGWYKQLHHLALKAMNRNNIHLIAPKVPKLIAGLARLLKSGTQATAQAMLKKAICPEAASSPSDSLQLDLSSHLTHDRQIFIATLLRDVSFVSSIFSYANIIACEELQMPLMNLIFEYAKSPNFKMNMQRDFLERPEYASWENFDLLQLFLGSYRAATFSKPSVKAVSNLGQFLLELSRSAVVSESHCRTKIRVLHLLGQLPFINELVKENPSAIELIINSDSDPNTFGALVDIMNNLELKTLNRLCETGGHFAFLKRACHLPANLSMSIRTSLLELFHRFCLEGDAWSYSTSTDSSVSMLQSLKKGPNHAQYSLTMLRLLTAREAIYMPNIFWESLSRYLTAELMVPKPLKQEIWDIAISLPPFSKFLYSSTNNTQINIIKYLFPVSFNPKFLIAESFFANPKMDTMVYNGFLSSCLAHCGKSGTSSPDVLFLQFVQFLFNLEEKQGYKWLLSPIRCRSPNISQTGLLDPIVTQILFNDTGKFTDFWTVRWEKSMASTWHHELFSNLQSCPAIVVAYSNGFPLYGIYLSQTDKKLLPNSKHRDQSCSIFDSAGVVSRPTTPPTDWEISFGSHSLSVRDDFVLDFANPNQSKCSMQISSLNLLPITSLKVLTPTPFSGPSTGHNLTSLIMNAMSFPEKELFEKVFSHVIKIAAISAEGSRLVDTASEHIFHSLGPSHPQSSRLQQSLLVIRAPGYHVSTQWKAVCGGDQIPGQDGMTIQHNNCVAFVSQQIEDKQFVLLEYQPDDLQQQSDSNVSSSSSSVETFPTITHFMLSVIKLNLADSAPDGIILFTSEYPIPVDAIARTICPSPELARHADWPIGPTSVIPLRELVAAASPSQLVQKTAVNTIPFPQKSRYILFVAINDGFAPKPFLLSATLVGTRSFDHSNPYVPKLSYMLPFFKKAEVRSVSAVTPNDENEGILYCIGTEWRAQRYINPGTSDHVGVTLSDSLFRPFQMDKNMVVGREAKQCFWGKKLPVWFEIDLREYAVKPTHFHFRHGYEADNSFIQDWTLSGSNNKVDWEVVFSADKPSHSVSFQLKTFAVNTVCTTFYRFWRVTTKSNYFLSAGVEGMPMLCCSGFDLYGEVSFPLKITL